MSKTIQRQSVNGISIVDYMLKKFDKKKKKRKTKISTKK